MIKKILFLVLCIMISITILFTGCAKEEVINDTEGVSKETENNDDTEIKNTMEDIQAVLEKDVNIADIIWRDDNLQVAYTKDIGDYQKQIYIWRVGEESEKIIEGVSGNFYDISYSPNNKYITVNEGTSNIYETIIISSESLQIVDRVVNAGGPVWSPDSTKIAFVVLNDKEPIIPIELSGTTDLMIYDINTNTNTVVLEADNDFFYNPLVWDQNGIKYQKNYLDDREPEELIYEDTGYDITTETYIEKTENMEVEIKYPVVKNIANKDVENKINNIIIDKAAINKEPVEDVDETFKETLYTDYEVTKKTEDILSIYFFLSAYMEGAAHPSRYIDSVTFDVKTGNVLELKDLFNKDADYKNTLNSILNEKVNELDFELFEEYKGIEEEQGFYLTDDSLVVYYQEGVYTPYAFGPLFLEVLLDDKVIRDGRLSKNSLFFVC